MNGRGTDKGRYYRTGIAAAGAALFMMSMPVALIELAVTSTGLSESLPAAAPPLGLTARLLLAAFAALMAAGLSLIIMHENRAEHSAEGDRKMGFALLKLAAFTRGRDHGADTGLPVLRRADAHPDAPARRPIFASSDFRGVEIFRQPFSTATPVPADRPATTAQIVALFEEEPRDPIVAGHDLTLPNSPAPLADEEMLRLAGRHAGAATGPVAQSPVPVPDIADSSDSSDIEAEDTAAIVEALSAKIPAAPATADLTVADLAARFERGLARRIALAEANAANRRAADLLSAAATSAATTTNATASGTPPMLADVPPATPVPVRPDVDAEVDAALRQALGTLQRMTSRG